VRGRKFSAEKVGHNRQIVATVGWTNAPSFYHIGADTVTTHQTFDSANTSALSIRVAMTGAPDLRIPSGPAVSDRTQAIYMTFLDRFAKILKTLPKGASVHDDKRWIKLNSSSSKEKQIAIFDIAAVFPSCGLFDALGGNAWPHH
jgi:hypothetical protein